MSALTDAHKKGLNRPIHSISDGMLVENSATAHCIGQGENFQMVVCITLYRHDHLL